MRSSLSSVGRRAVKIVDRDIFDAATARAALERAWKRVEQNGGASGGDGVTIERFQQATLAALGRLSHDLREGSYQPRAMRSVEIPKRGGGLRHLTIPSVIDRVAQTAVTQVLGPLLDAEFEDSSFAYRSGRSVAQAVRRVTSLRAAGLTHVIDADIDDYFDSVPHDVLMARLAESMDDGPLTRLIALWLSHFAPQGRGLTQGSPLSPLLANLFLDRLDEGCAARDMRIVRYADDFVILAANAANADAALERVRGFLFANGLKLNVEKTRVTNFEAGFRFLGHMFVRSLVLRPQSAETDDDEFTDPDALLAAVARQDALTALTRDKAAGELESAEARGLSPGLRILHITEPGRRLSVRNQAFCVEEAGGAGELLSVPHRVLDRIDLHPGTEWTQPAIDHALATGVVIALVEASGRTKGFVANSVGHRAGLQLAQAAAVLDPARRLAMARALVEGKLRNQRSALRRLVRGRDHAPAAVTAALAELTRFLGRGDISRVRLAPSLPTVMGYEGAAAAAYWKAIGALCPPDFSFVTRQRRTGQTRAGIVLDFLCWMLHRDVAVAVAQAGLHPGFGALHSSSDQHDACVYDLMEEFRAHATESLLVYLANRQILRNDMFTNEGDRTQLLPEGRRALIRGYETRMTMTTNSARANRRVTYRRLIVEQAFAYARACQDGVAYISHHARD